MTLSAWEAREAAVGPQAVTPVFIQELKRARKSKKSRRADTSTSNYPTPQSQVQGAGSSGTGTSELTNFMTFESPALLSENATSPALFANDVEEIDWQLWDQMFAQGTNADFGPNGEWSMGFRSNE